MATRILVGHVLDKLRELPAENIHCVVTSPPYYGLRSYGTEPQVWGGDPACCHDFETETVKGDPRGEGNWQQAATRDIGHGGRYVGDMVAARAMQPQNVAERGQCRHCNAWRGDLGLEPTPWQYIEHLVLIFREINRVLRRDGTCWVNIAGSYAGSWGAQGRKETPATLSRHSIKNHPKKASGTGTIRIAPPSPCDCGSCGICLIYGIGRVLRYKPKDRMHIPELLSMALVADGWWDRSDVAWCKRAPMPESCTDRPTTAWEHVFLLTKSAKYFYDQEAVKEESIDEPGVSRGGSLSWFGRDEMLISGNAHRGKTEYASNGKRNMRNVWHLGPEPFPEAHFATFPTEIPRRCIKAGTSEKGVCPKCGAPWCRRTQVSGGMRDQSWHNHVDDLRVGQRGGQSGYRGDDAKAYANQRIETIGWRPSCSCADGDYNTDCGATVDIEDAFKPIPATALDPFLGAGTTGLVADELQRNCIGIELNPAYAEMAERRIHDGGGMFVQLDSPQLKPAVVR